MDESQKEILLITQEECAEVTQAISKVFRFGIQAEYNDKTNRDRLTEELGDLLCMIELCYDSGVVDYLQVKYTSPQLASSLSRSCTHSRRDLGVLGVV